MNRSILNMEATVSSAGRSDSGQDVYVVRLWMNHHHIKSWTVPMEAGYLMTQDRAHLDEFVASKFYSLWLGEP